MSAGRYGNPVILAFGVLLVFGAGNAMAEAITGEYPLSGGSSEDAEEVSRSDSGWERPVATGEIGTRYGAKGDSWASGHHTGVDFKVPAGTPVVASSTGLVVASGSGGSYGNQVVIKHADGKYSQYAHLSRADVRKGEKVDRGQVIGLSGNTGNSTGPHLHFEVRTGPDYGSDVDPTPFIGRKN